MTAFIFLWSKHFLEVQNKMDVIISYLVDILWSKVCKIYSWCYYYTKYLNFYKRVKATPTPTWIPKMNPTGSDMTAKLFSGHKQSLYSPETPKTCSEKNRVLVVGRFSHTPQTLANSRTYQEICQISSMKSELLIRVFEVFNFFLRHNL